jgi:predicted nucleotidyltransferase
MNEDLLKARLRFALKNHPGVELVYLFGSQIGGNTGPQSDYDLGVLINQAEDVDFIRDQFAYEVGRALDTDPIDVLLLNEAPVELAYSVIAQGIPLYQRDLATRVEYEAQIMSRYGDYLPVLRAQRDDILRGDEHGTRVQRYREALGRTERALGEITAA